MACFNQQNARELCASFEPGPPEDCVFVSALLHGYHSQDSMPALAQEDERHAKWSQTTAVTPAEAATPRLSPSKISRAT